MKAKKINLSADYLTALSTADLTTYHYKVLLLLAVQTMTQAQIADFLQIKKQNINKYVVELTKMGLLEVDRIEGRNKFLKAVNSFPKVSEQTPNVNQMKLSDIWTIEQGNKTALLIFVFSLLRIFLYVAKGRKMAAGECVGRHKKERKQKKEKKPILCGFLAFFFFVIYHSVTHICIIRWYIVETTVIKK